MNVRSFGILNLANCPGNGVTLLARARCENAVAGASNDSTVLIQCGAVEVLLAHSHMHAETGGEAETILNGTAVPFTINDEFLVRGDVF